MLSVLIPFRATFGSQRERILHRILQLWAQVPGVQLCLGTDGGDGDELFSVARAFNAARSSAAGDRLLLVGADHVPPDEQTLARILADLEVRPWIGVFAKTWQLTEGATEQVLAGAEPSTVAGQHTLIPSCEGIVALRADAWDAVGGMDARFVGYGPEDRAFRVALETAFPDGIGAGSGHVISLWHEPAPRDRVRANQAIYREYTDALQAARRAREIRAMDPNSATGQQIRAALDAATTPDQRRAAEKAAAAAGLVLSAGEPAETAPEPEAVEQTRAVDELAPPPADETLPPAPVDDTKTDAGPAEQTNEEETVSLEDAAAARKAAAEESGQGLNTPPAKRTAPAKRTTAAPTAENSPATSAPAGEL